MQTASPISLAALLQKATERHIKMTKAQTAKGQ